MNRFLRPMAALSRGCGKLPLLAAVLACLALCAEQRGASLTAAEAQDGPVPELVSDAQRIDEVLARRAPGLGLTLRRQIGRAIAEEAQKAHYDPLLILAIINVESDFDEAAVSPVGARGLMQIMPTTLYFLAQQEGLRLSREEVAADPALCARLGIRYLRKLHDRFGDLDLALMAYNAGPTKLVRAAKNKHLDLFRPYPRWVRRGYRAFREGQGLGGDWAWASRETGARR